MADDQNNANEWTEWEGPPYEFGYTWGPMADHPDHAALVAEG